MSETYLTSWEIEDIYLHNLRLKKPAVFLETNSQVVKIVRSPVRSRPKPQTVIFPIAPLVLLDDQNQVRLYELLQISHVQLSHLYPYTEQDLHHV